MNNEKVKKIHIVVENLNKIMVNRKMSKVNFANLIDIPEAKWNKISNGQQNLDLHDLSKIAINLKMREIDIFTYPEIYERKSKDADKNSAIIEDEVSLLIKLKKDKKDQLLKLVFGENCLEILNK